MPLRRRERSAASEAYARAKMPSGRTPWRQARYVVVDLETTGLDPRSDEIISFASIPVTDGRVVIGDAMTMLVRPNRMPPAETIRIHGLRAGDLEGTPGIESALDSILGALSGRVLVAHVAQVESGFLSPALRTAGARLARPILDTAALALAALDADGEPAGTVHPAFGRQRRAPPGLSDTARRLGLPVHRPHHADGDALTTAQVFIALATRLDARNPQTVRSLARLSKW